MAIYMPTGFGLAIFRFLLDGDPEEMVVTMGFDGSGGVVPSGDVLAEDFADAWLAGTAAADMSSEYKFVGTTLRWNEGGGGLSVYEHLSNLDGTWTGQSLPSNCAVLVRKNTTQAGRRGKGRMYIPPFSVDEANVNGRGELATSTLNNLQAQYEAFLTAFEAVLPAVLFHDTPPGGTDMAPTAIIGVTVQNPIATRRLRMRP